MRSLLGYEPRHATDWQGVLDRLPEDASACVAEDGSYIRYGQLMSVVVPARAAADSLIADPEEREDRWLDWIGRFGQAARAEQVARGYNEPEDDDARPVCPRFTCAICRGTGKVAYTIRDASSALVGQRYYRVCACEAAEIYGPAAMDPTGSVAIDGRLARAGLPGLAIRQGWTLDSYGQEPIGAEGRGALDIAREYAKGLAHFRPQFGNKTALLMSGDYGTGKTGLVCGILRAITEDNPAATIRFISWAGLLSSLKDAYSSRTGADRILLQTLQDVTCLGLDDIGDVERTEGSAWERQTAEDILLSRYNRGAATLFTTNLTRAQLERQLGGRLADRIYGDWAVVLDIPGKSLRGRDDVW